MDLAKIRKKARKATQDGASLPISRHDGAAETAPGPPATVSEPPAPAPIQPPPSPPPPQFAEPAPEPPKAPSRWERMLLFSLGRQHYAMPIQDISLIIEDRPATPIPNAPAFVTGIVSLRGKIVIILDARRRLSLEDEAKAESMRIIVLDRGADQFGLLVDSIENVLDVDLATLEPVPEGFTPMEQEFVNGVFYHRSAVVATLDLEKLLDFVV